MTEYNEETSGGLRASGKADGQHIHSTSRWSHRSFYIGFALAVAFAIVGLYLPAWCGSILTIFGYFMGYRLVPPSQVVETTVNEF